ncbi:unnamed protein product [Rotaria magnacalcarata]|uniref:Steroid 5-alpha reductase C-terminal domain-containing protein n=2 Tax=Rotaria magnacalcarata TaxID=392030 RepID=A0A815XXX2_9BILA|nr:unnamed protein product [Rotaria magnacalcarata]CAF1684338.1 unnamed protein product [Rotaria magnacalcarata]CAF2013094.1 unnamed protein product [Rotaria magnacalcarata]CAF2014557.1 unnamed protein product [Rotaria magnacalcarata]CAF2037657.1 unnamed protein product [Rotaria magnacalcarata]
MGLQLGKLIGIDFAIQFLGWALSVKFRTERHFDLTGSLTFILLTYLSRNKRRSTLRQNIQSSCVFFWALRLGAFLFYRILKVGKDSRFDRMRNNPTRLLITWMIQGIWVLITLLPTLYLNQKQVDKPLTKTDYVGWILWLFGFIFETIADKQKMSFKNNLNNKNAFIETGLWKYSRHPNYFGEMCAWFGLYISSSHMLVGYERFFGVLSPIFVTLLISFLSGIPILERQAMKLFASNPAYQAYRKRTPILIPFLNFPRI